MRLHAQQMAGTLGDLFNQQMGSRHRHPGTLAVRDFDNPRASELLQGFAHQPELVVFQIAQPAVDQLGAGGRGMPGQIVLLHQQHRQPAPGGIARDPRTVDPPADDQQVVSLVVGQGTAQVRGPSKLAGAA